MAECINSNLGKLLTKYEMGQLDEKEIDLFEKHLMDCDFCQKEITEMMPVAMFFNDNREEIIERLQKEGITFELLKKGILSKNIARKGICYILKENFYSTFKIILKIKRPLILIPAAAVILIAILISTYLFHGQHSKGFNESHLYFKKLPFKDYVPRGESAIEAEELFKAGMKFYQQDDYENAVIYLNNAVEKFPNNGIWHLYLGISYYLNHQSESAIKKLITAEELTEGSFKLNSRWYLANSYLLKGDIDKAVPILNWIKEYNRTYSTEADSLLSRLNR